METADEVIALLLEDPDGFPTEPIDLASTLYLVRSSDGHMRLEKPASLEMLARTAASTGVFKRGAPIVDPSSGDVIGYEMEEIPHGAAATR